MRPMTRLPPSRAWLSSFAALSLLAAMAAPAFSQGLPNERPPTPRGAAQGNSIDPESGTPENAAPSESDESPRGGMPTGQSNLPLPRFASLRAGEVNMRTGTWRKIRDEQGAEGWVHRSMLSGKRSAVTIGKAGSSQILRRAAEEGSAAVAKLEPGVLVNILECDGPWCRLETHGFRGWLPRKGLWGVKDGERIK
jgi:SH3-like domain-containing protein